MSMDPFDNMTGGDFAETLKSEPWKEVYQRLHTPNFEATLLGGGLLLLFPDGQRRQFERSDVEALTRFLNQYAGVEPLPAASDPFPEGWTPMRGDESEEPSMSEQRFNQEQEERHTPTPADEALSAGLLTVQVVGAIQQAYADGKIVDLETYNHLYEVARKADTQVRKLASILEQASSPKTPDDETPDVGRE